jgi:hypothetical protein
MMDLAHVRSWVLTSVERWARKSSVGTDWFYTEAH